MPIGLLFSRQAEWHDHGSSSGIPCTLPHCRESIVIHRQRPGEDSVNCPENIVAIEGKRSCFVEGHLPTRIADVCDSQGLRTSGNAGGPQEFAGCIPGSAHADAAVRAASRGNHRFRSDPQAINPATRVPVDPQADTIVHKLDGLLWGVEADGWALPGFCTGRPLRPRHMRPRGVPEGETGIVPNASWLPPCSGISTAVSIGLSPHMRGSPPGCSALPARSTGARVDGSQ
jgi:hypothetical protein